MFGKQVTLFELLGFKVKVDASWLFLAALVTWSLAQGYFPQTYAGFSTATYWWMGICGAIGMFLSLILHELSHSVVARHYGLPIRGITLFIFGGVAEMEEEPASPKAEFQVAIAGPIASVLLAGAFYALSAWGASMKLPETVVGVTHYLAFINGLLAAFNVIPAFPLDGGRVLRAALWYWKADLRQATRIASRVGGTFAFLLIALGVINLLGGNVVGGMWWVLIGWFLRGAASSGYYQVETRRAMEGEPVRRFMVADPVTVSPDISVRAFIDDYVYTSHHDLYPVTDNGRLLGCVGIREVREAPRDKWDWITVGRIAAPCSDENTVDADADAIQALSRMQRSSNSRLMVTKNGRLVGIVTLKDMLKLLALKIDLEGVE